MAEMQDAEMHDLTGWRRLQVMHVKCYTCIPLGCFWPAGMA